MKMLSHFLRREVLHFSGGLRFLAALVGLTIVLHCLAVTVLVDSYSTDLLRILKGLVIPLILLVLCICVGAADSPRRKDRELATRPVPFGRLFVSKAILVLFLAAILVGLQSLMSVACGLDHGFFQMFPVIASAGFLALLSGRILTKKAGIVLLAIYPYSALRDFFLNYIYNKYYFMDDRVFEFYRYLPGFDLISLTVLAVVAFWLSYFPQSRMWKVLMMALLAFLGGRFFFSPTSNFLFLPRKILFSSPAESLLEGGNQAPYNTFSGSVSADSLKGKFILDWSLHNWSDYQGEGKDRLLLSANEIESEPSFRDPIGLQFFRTLLIAENGKTFRIPTYNRSISRRLGDDAKPTARILGGDKNGGRIPAVIGSRDRGLKIEVVIPEELRGQIVKVQIEGFIHHWKLEDFGTLAENSGQALRTQNGTIKVLTRETGKRNRTKFRVIYENGHDDMIYSYRKPYLPGVSSLLFSKRLRNDWAISGMSSVENFWTNDLLTENQEIGFFGWSYQGVTSFRTKPIEVDFGEINQPVRIRHRANIDLVPTEIETSFD